VSPLWLTLLVALPVLDSVFRGVLLVAARRRRPGGPGEIRRRVLVLVPARDEGAAVAPTLRSVLDAAGSVDVRPVLVLDGDDEEAAAVAGALGVEVVRKEPPGPSKAAVLAWAVGRLAADLEGVEAVVVLDVGSRLGEGFFDRLRWPSGADGVQAVLAGGGVGPGDGASLSERVAQAHEDRGREALGWNVRLRGTGFALRPPLLEAVAGALRTQVEDTEMSLLLGAAGARLALGPADAVVHDVKPGSVRDAARQRARWLVGQLALPLRQPRALLRLLARRPLEGLAFATELGGRPLSLTVPLRLLVAGAIATAVGARPGAELAVAAVVAASAFLDVGVHVLSGGFRLRAALGLAASWLRAVWLVPAALKGWMRGRESGTGTGTGTGTGR